LFYLHDDKVTVFQQSSSPSLNRVLGSLGGVVTELNTGRLKNFVLIPGR